ncbi:hypothetical protein CK203_096699 [Vitis vinifera]|uniref:Uncharacterized protein n=1 Tax=Vitis vinifera TaxID=29760 RepID=A0A438C309_VITVI|nr:hypothetical protein CK203_096699 [Vitis vinifera]
MDFNSPTSAIPNELRNLTALSVFDLSSIWINFYPCQLQELYVIAFGSMNSLESLDLRFNNLSAEILISLTLLDCLSSLYLSYNNFSRKFQQGCTSEHCSNATIDVEDGRQKFFHGIVFLGLCNRILGTF